ncbi:hypothetical protein GCM10028807_36140 [Spirosoma daeguense]
MAQNLTVRLKNISRLSFAKSMLAGKFIINYGFFTTGDFPYLTEESPVYINKYIVVLIVLFEEIEQDKTQTNYTTWLQF